MLNFLVAEDRIKNLKILLASSTPVQFLYKPWAKWCSWAMLSFGEDILFLVNNKWFDCFLSLLFFIVLFLFFCELFRNTRTKTNWLSIGKKGSSFRRKRVIAALKNNNQPFFPISIAFFQFAWWSVFYFMFLFLLVDSFIIQGFNKTIGPTHLL